MHSLLHVAIYLAVIVGLASSLVVVWLQRSPRRAGASDSEDRHRPSEGRATTLCGSWSRWPDASG